DRRAETDRRQSDPDLDPRNPDADESQRAAERHHHREGDWEEPHRRRPELRAPETDGDHREDVVEAGHRVREPGDEAGALAPLRVREGGGRPEEEAERERRDPARTAHAVHPKRIAVRWIVQNAPRVPTA